MSTSNIKWFDLFWFKKGKPFIFAALLCLVGSAYFGGMMPKKIAELAQLYEQKDNFIAALKGLALLFLGIYANRVFYQLCINKYVQYLMQKARLECYTRWLHVYDLHTSKEDHRDEYPQGEVIARIMNDTEAIRELMTSGSFGILIDLFFVVSCLISFVTINQTSGLFLGGVEVLAALLLIWGSRHMRDIFLSVRKSRGQMSRTIANLVGGIRETYYTRHDHYAVKRGIVDFDDYLGKILYSNVWDAGYYSLAESLYPILLALVVFIFPYSGITEAALIFAVVDLIQRSIGPIKDVSAKIANIQRAYSGIIRIQEFLGDLSRGHSTFNQQIGTVKAVVDRVKVEIEYFSYPGRKSESDQQFSLRNISLEVSKGQLVGLVGTSGSGKSTLFNIISGNIIPQKGGVQVSLGDGLQREFPGNFAEDIITYRQLVGLVSQESHLFSESLAFNLSLSPKVLSNETEEKDFEQFWKWVREQIPYLVTWGIDKTDIINIKSISLGQRQLLAAIRACYLKKPIVLFDEISSGLDSELELALRKMVLLIQENALTFIVAHRLETVIESDLILLMEDGQLIDSGRHQALSQSSTAYRAFLAEISQPS